MKKGDIVEGKIEEYSFPNKGSFKHIEENEQAEGGQIERTISVKGVLPGQTVKARIKKKKKSSSISRDTPRTFCKNVPTTPA